MTGDLLALVLRTQLVASVAIFGLLALRRLRTPLDPDARIWLWTIAPVAALASLLPKQVFLPDPYPASAVPPASLAAPWLQALVDVWFIGAAVALIRVAVLHLAFLREVRRGHAGPAVTGVVRPKIVMPRASIFAPEEQALIRAHEWEHIRRGDLGVRNLLVLVQCLFWFNPLIHIAAAELRLDQELACDEAVVSRLGRRRLYAQTLLKFHEARPSPLGCHWLAGGVHPLETRLATLARRPVTEERRTVTTALGLAAGLVATVAAAATSPERHAPGWVVAYETPAAQTSGSAAASAPASPQPDR